VRTRFAPSPTGFLHVGALRTALFAWLVAKKTKDAFTLRIEDTDQAREVKGATENIIRTLQLAGIPPDEGVMLDDSGAIIEKGPYGPYHQSKRLPIYKEHVQKLLDGGHAYHCFCTPDRLEAMRKRQQELKQAPMYDRTCIDLPKDEIDKRIAAGEKHVVRMKIPREKTITYDDMIYGTLTFKGPTIDDQVLLKSDGFPTYHLAHVVDDRLMKTDIVIRGEEWLSSLPKHLILFDMFGWETPKYAHVPLLLNKDRTKLSKRQNDVAAEDYLKKGYLPEALLNFLVMLGWNPGTEQELFSLQELVDAFSLERVQKSGAIFDLEKLDWIQGQWMRKIPVEEFAARIRPLVEEKFPAAKKDKSFVERVALIQERITFFPEAPEMLGYFYEPPKPTMDLVASAKQKIEANDVPKILEILQKILSSMSEKDWNRDGIAAAIEKALPESGFKKGQLLWPLRAMLTGREYSPGAYEVAALLGKEETMQRLTKTIVS
jgi:nondiscriminating glutamyl-tRNA synthetase